jgi:hypothetical protein
VKCSYYIYYRSGAEAARVRAAVAPMQARLAELTGVTGRLLRRVDDATTWMEIYEEVADPARFEPALAAAVDGFGLRALLAPGADRHVERFTAG